jgi:hypothetical protein
MPSLNGLTNSNTQECNGMLQLERISQTSPIFEKNISALRQRQPALAERLSSVDLPASIQWAAGRDGLPVIIQSISDTHIKWMGGSSMPSVSAPAVLANFVDKGVNVALPSIGTGYECLRLIERVQPHCAVFVCEESTERLAATLCVVDLSTSIGDGRLIFLDGDIEESLPKFIDVFPGYDFPTQLLVLPEFDAAQFKARTDAVHRACHLAADQHAKHAGGHKQNVTFKRRASDNKPRIAVVSVDTVGGAIEHARKIERAAGALGWKTTISVPDHPQSCSLVSRVQAVAGDSIEFVLMINGTPGRLAEYLPGGISVACWFLDDSRLPPVAFEGVSEMTHLIAASGDVQQKLIAQGGRADCIRLIEKGVDHLLFERQGETERRFESVLVLVDGEDLSPKAAHVGLESHEKLWAEMQRCIAQASDRKKPMDLPEMLKKAERSTGIKLNDEDLRRQFLAIVTQRVPKTIVARTTVEAMISNGFAVDLFGRHWASHGSVSSGYRGTIPAADRRAQELLQAGCVVFPFVDSAAMGYCLEAIAAGCLPLIRDDHTGCFGRYPEASRVLSKVPSFGSYTELLALLRKWNNPSAEREQRVQSLRSELLENLRTIDRLAEIQNWIWR